MRFVAALDTIIFGVEYQQGAEVDTTGWTRKMLLQFLELGIIQAAYLTAGAISDRIIFQGDGVTTTVNGEGKIVVSIDPEVPSAYADLSDVNMGGLADGDIAVWDAGAGQWRPEPLPTSSGGGGGTVSDPRWAVPVGWTSIDEFDDGALHGDWVKAGHTSIPGGAVPTYTEGNGVLSVAYMNATTEGAAARHHAIVRPIGTTMANGDAFITSFRVMTKANLTFRMSGLVLSTSGSSGAGNQLYARHHNGTGGRLTMKWLSSWSGDNTLGQNYDNLGNDIRYQRLVRISATTWRADLSTDGVQWITHDVVTWANEPTHVGFCHSRWDTATPSVGSYEFLRRVSGVS